MKKERLELFWFDVKWFLQNADQKMEKFTIVAAVSIAGWIAWNLATVMIAPIRYYPDTYDARILYREEHRWFSENKTTTLRASWDSELEARVWMHQGKDGHWYRALREADSGPDY
jgi:hypothetical protein